MKLWRFCAERVCPWNRANSGLGVDYPTCVFRERSKQRIRPRRVKCFACGVMLVGAIGFALENIMMVVLLMIWSLHVPIWCGHGRHNPRQNGSLAYPHNVILTSCLILRAGLPPH